MVTLDVGRLSRFANFGHHDIDAARREVHGRRQADGAGAYHEHLGLNLPHSFSLGWPHRPARGALTLGAGLLVAKYLAGSDASD
jgi:hypothetical protein